MTDLLAWGSNWLESQRTRFATQEVTYQRGVDVATVKATIGRTVFEQVDDFGHRLRIESRDYLILAADLVLGDAVTLPQRGDRIVEQDGVKQQVYEVLAPGKEPHYRHSDPYRQTLRIHTKHVETIESIR